MHTAKELLGEEDFEVDRQYGWVGDGGFFMHDILDGGETEQCVICQVVNEAWGENEWSRTLDQSGLEKIVESWTDTPLKKGIIEAMLQNSDLKAFAQTHHSVDAPSYTNGRVCIMGDAAHSTTPWQGSGASQAIEDPMILEALLTEVKTPGQIAIALKAYDQIRRPRTQRIVHSSYITGLLLCGRGEDVGLDVEKLRAELPGRWRFIYSQDQAQHELDALSALEALQHL